MTLPRVRTWLKTLANLPALVDVLKDMQRELYRVVPAPRDDKAWREIGMLQQRVERLEDRVMGLTRLYAGDDLAKRLPTRHDDFSADTDDDNEPSDVVIGARGYE